MRLNRLRESNTFLKGKNTIRKLQNLITWYEAWRWRQSQWAHMHPHSLSHMHGHRPITLTADAQHDGAARPV
jgi:hypothetical protein